MVLVDTSVWIEHLRHGRAELATLLLEGEVLCHPFIVGELACGNLSNRAEFLALIRQLPSAERAGDDDVCAFIDSRRLMGRGIGYIDMHLLLSTRLSGATLWTEDRRLRAIAASLGLLH